jgi:hypothetical protein
MYIWSSLNLNGKTLGNLKVFRFFSSSDISDIGVDLTNGLRVEFFVFLFYSSFLDRCFLYVCKKGFCD